MGFKVQSSVHFLSVAQVKKEEQWAEDDQWRQERLNHRKQKLGRTTTLSVPLLPKPEDIG